MNDSKLRYPIGKFEVPKTMTKEILAHWISDISSFPEKLKNEVLHLTDAQLDTPYRHNGWTIRQVIHHCADSHINSFIRFKLTLTEEKPVIKPYYEDRWAELPDGKTFPIESSIKILEGLHERWTFILKNLTNQELEKSFIHPEHKKEFNLAENMGLYAWHCRHHLAHIITLKQQNEWE